MRFPIYWKKVHNATKTLSARGWSDTSQDEATQRAEERLARIVAWFQSNRDRDLDRYRYVMDDNICEAVIDRIADAEGKEIAVISRNAYGSLVMNAANVMMIDIDFGLTAKVDRSAGFLARLFGAKRKSPEAIEAAEVERIRQWQREHPEISLRVYRTAAGLRAFVINQIFPEVDRSVLATMEELHSDPLYRDLCTAQKCFRARLTPKPWRIGMASPLERFPFESKEAEERFQIWFDEYTTKCKRYAVCRFIEQIGLATPHPNALQLIEFHDRLCCKSNLPLA